MSAMTRFMGWKPFCGSNCSLKTIYKILSKFQTFVHLYRDESFVNVIVVFSLAYKVGHI